MIYNLIRLIDDERAKGRNSMKALFSKELDR